jgi:hypothetical protein
MPTECELCHEMYEKADDDPQDICLDCWEVQASYWTGATTVELDEQAQRQQQQQAEALSDAMWAALITPDTDGGSN